MDLNSRKVSGESVFSFPFATRSASCRAACPMSWREGTISTPRQDFHGQVRACATTSRPHPEPMSPKTSDLPTGSGRSEDGVGGVSRSAMCIASNNDEKG